MDVEEAVATTQSEDLGGAAVSQSDDKIISAEIPDSTPERRELRKIVLRTMVHMRHEMLQRQGRGARRRRSPARRRRPRAEECRAADRHRQPELCGVLKSAKKALKSAPPPPTPGSAHHATLSAAGRRPRIQYTACGALYCQRRDGGISRQVRKKPAPLPPPRPGAEEPLADSEEGGDSQAERCTAVGVLSRMLYRRRLLLCST